MSRNNVKYEGKSIYRRSVLQHTYEESDVKVRSVSFFDIVYLFFNALGPTFNQLCDSTGGKKSFRLHAKPQMHRIFHFLEDGTDRPSRNFCRKLQFYAA